MIHSVCSYPCYKWRKQLPKWSPVLTICTAQWSLYLPPILTFNNSAFCPHSVFMCFVWIWEQTAIISLYNINWLVSITEMECVYCAVRTVFLGIIEVYSVHVKYLVDTVTLGQVFSCQYRSIVAPCSSLSTCCFYEDKRTKAGNLPKSNAIAEIWEHWVSAYTFLMLEGLDKMTDGGSRVAAYATHASLTVI
jgi:hypothetical protein